MATIILITDTPISSLMPSGGGALASGDTIQLAGHSLIIDADAVDYPVTIANGGGGANLELRDLGRIRLNATLPATVHPYIDPAHPLPVSAEPGIDGDPYRTPLTANARAEIQLAGNFGLGGGSASLPTAKREGAFWATLSQVDGARFMLSRPMPLHVGDVLVWLGHSLFVRDDPRTVVGYDASANIVTLDAIPTITSPQPWAMVSGGVLVNVHLGSLVNGVISAKTSAGVLNVFSFGYAGGTNFSYCLGGNPFCADRFVWYPDPRSYFGSFPMVGDHMSIQIGELVAGRVLTATKTAFGNLDIGEVACSYLAHDTTSTTLYGADVSIRGGIVAANTANYFGPNCNISLRGISVAGNIATQQDSSVELRRSSVSGVVVETARRIASSGVITLNATNGAWYHVPATAADVTWRYTDRTVPAGATLRLHCAWMREGSTATRANVAVTDAATWWPQLWPLGADALASVEFTGGAADWAQQLLTWRNTGTEAVQVRVWECVTGAAAGGYLKVKEVKGGQL